MNSFQFIKGARSHRLLIPALCALPPTALTSVPFGLYQFELEVQAFALEHILFKQVS